MLPTTLRARTALLAATALLALAACAGPAAVAPADDTRVVTDQYGEVTISGLPRRVVAPNNPASDIALELGVPLVAQGEWGPAEGGVPAWRRPLLTGDVPVIPYSADGYNIEETLAMEPDLVLAGFDMTEDEYRQLSAAVPVVSPAFDTPADEIVRTIGEALGLRAEADALVAETDAAVAAAAVRHPELAGRTIAIATSGEAGTLYNGGAPLVENFWASGIGLRPAPGTASLSDFDAIGAEQWSAFDGDLLFVGYQSDAERAQYESSELFARIPAVAAGRYLGSSDPDDFESLRAVSPAHVRWALENLLPRLAETAR